MLSFFNTFETLFGDCWESPWSLGGDPNRVITGYVLNDSRGFFEQSLTLRWSNRDPSRSHLGKFSNIFEYSGTLVMRAWVQESSQM